MLFVKNKKVKLLILFVVLFVAFALVVGCGGGKNNNQGGNVEREKYDGYTKLSIAASSTGSSTFAKLTVWAGYISSELGIDITPEGSEGSSANAQLVGIGEVELGGSMSDIATQAYRGEGFMQGTPLKDIRAMLTLDPFALQFYTLEGSGIKSIYDLEGRSISLSNAGSGTDQWARRVFEYFGIKPIIRNISPSEANELIRDGVLDAAAVMGSVHPAIVELNATQNIIVFGVGKEESEEFVKDWEGMFPTVIRSGSYQGIDYDFYTLGEVGIIVVNNKLPEDLVYDMTKATYEGKERMAEGYPGFSIISPEDIASVTLPLHKGAYKYFVEIGINVPSAAMPVD